MNCFLVDKIFFHNFFLDIALLPRNVKKMRCRIAVLWLLLSAVCLPVRGQWECALYGGVGLPVLSGDNAPPLRTSLATALRGGYALGESWLLTAEVGQLQQLRQEHPNLEALILDTAFHVKRYQFIPIMLGVGYRLPLSRPANHNITFQIALGTHFRYIHCQQQTSPMVVDDRGESGWGLAGKLSAELTLWNHLSLQLWYMAMGSPGDGEWKPESKKATYIKSHWHIEGYRQSSWGISLGYKF